MKYLKGDITNFRELWFLDQYLAGIKGFVAGGCFKNILSGQRAKDLDIFFRNQADFADALNVYKGYITSKSEWIKSYENKKVFAAYNSKTKVRVELNRSIFGTPEDILNDFDFTITQFAYYSQSAIKEEVRDTDVLAELDDTILEFKVIYHPDFFEHLQQKRLVISNLPFPVSTFERSLRYTKYGFGLCKESKVKLVKALHDIPILDDNALSNSLYNGKD